MIEGDAAYTALMRRLPERTTTCSPLTFNTYWEQLHRQTSHARRLLNKLLGRPATSEVAVLASMISKLLEATQAWLGHEQAITAAVVSSPVDIGLEPWELHDLFDYLRLKNLVFEADWTYLFDSTSAAFAGYWKDICHTFTDTNECERGTLDFSIQSEGVLHLDINNESFGGTLMSLDSPILGGLVHAAFIDASLGLTLGRGELAHTTGKDDASSWLYWKNVSTRIHELVDQVNKAHVNRLLLTGPGAANKQFLFAVKTALHNLVVDENVFSFLEDIDRLAYKLDWQSFVSFATARGAAEIAKRTQEGSAYCTQIEVLRAKEGMHGWEQPDFVHQSPLGKMV